MRTLNPRVSGPHVGRQMLCNSSFKGIYFISKNVLVTLLMSLRVLVDRRQENSGNLHRISTVGSLQ